MYMYTYACMHKHEYGEIALVFELNTYLDMHLCVHACTRMLVHGRFDVCTCL